MYKLPKIGELEYMDDGRIICHLCGNSYHKLGAHIFNTHHLTTSNYKQQFGLNKNTKLTSIEYQTRMRSKITDETIKVLQVAGEGCRFKKGSAGRPRDKIATEEMNRLKERCKHGVLRKIFSKL